LARHGLRQWADAHRARRRQRHHERYARLRLLHQPHPDQRADTAQLDGRPGTGSGDQWNNR
jgi:hypothetical protein